MINLYIYLSFVITKAPCILDSRIKMGKCYAFRKYKLKVFNIEYLSVKITINVYKNLHNRNNKQCSTFRKIIKSFFCIYR